MFGIAYAMVDGVLSRHGSRSRCNGELGWERTPDPRSSSCTVTAEGGIANGPSPTAGGVTSIHVNPLVGQEDLIKLERSKFGGLVLRLPSPRAEGAVLLCVWYCSHLTTL